MRNYLLLFGHSHTGDCYMLISTGTVIIMYIQYLFSVIVVS